MKTLLIISLIIGPGLAMAQLSAPGITPAAPSSGSAPVPVTTAPSTGDFNNSTPQRPVGDFNPYNNNSVTGSPPPQQVPGSTPNTFNFGDGSGFGNTDSGTGNSLRNSAFGPTTPLPTVSPQNFGGFTTPNTMQPGNQFNMGFENGLRTPGDPNVAPDSSLPQSSPSIQAQEFENDQFQQRRPGFR